MMEKTKNNKVIISLLIATFLTAIEGTIVSTAIPKIVEELHQSELYTWVISIYLLSTVITSAIYGKLADLFGRKVIFLIGVIIFLIGSIMCGVSQSMEQLVLFRLIQGIGGGALTTIPFVIIGDIIPIEKRGKIQGLIGSIWGISGILGPIVGGFIVDMISWRWIFLMNIPFGIISLIILWFSLYEQIEKKKQMIDYAGIFVFTISLSSLLYALTILKEQHQLNRHVLLFFLITLLGFGLFILIEKKAKEPMLPLTLFKNRLITVSNLAAFLGSIIYVAAAYYIPLWIQGITNLSATLSGIAVMPMSLTWPLGSTLAGKLIMSHSFKRISLIGTVVALAGCIVLAFAQMDTSLIWFMSVSAILGFGFGLTYTTFTIVVQTSVDWQERGAAMGSHSLMKNLGETVGISVLGLWLSSHLYGQQLETSLHTIFMILVGVAVLAIAVTCALSSKRAEQQS